MTRISGRAGWGQPAGSASPPQSPLRRDLLGGGAFALLVGLGVADWSQVAAAVSQDAFASTSLGEALELLGVQRSEAGDVDLRVPGLVEDGAVVPVTLTTSVADAMALYLLVETNPFPLAAAFELPQGTEPELSIRLKVNQSGAIHGLVRGPDGFHRGEAQVEVTRGGCN